jgi:peptidoglycan pentaglycine glycine transferase (the first glycine)
MTGSWNNLIKSLPGAHFLQTEQWGDIKSGSGWRPFFLCWTIQEKQLQMVEWREEIRSIKAAALVLERTFLKTNFLPEVRMIYVPKGPLVDWKDTLLVTKVLHDLVDFCKSRNGVFLKIDPDLIIGGMISKGSLTDDLLSSAKGKFLNGLGWVFSSEQVQFRNTFRIDLSLDCEQLLLKMKQKTRYNIRLASKKGVVIRNGSKADYESLYQLYENTAIRDGFVIRESVYYKMVWDKFIDTQMADLIVAEYGSELIAAVYIVQFGGKAWFLYGMSSNLHRDKMPNYLLQWEAIVRSKQNRCRFYDFWGAPDELTEEDQLWGVYRFKEGFGGQFIRTIGAWDYPIKKTVYLAFKHFYPIIVKLMKIKNKSHDQVQ